MAPVPRHSIRPRCHRARPARIAIAAAAIIAALSATTGLAVAQYVEPVEGPVVDPYRPPERFAGPGNRGWEYATVPGSPVRAAGSGIVAFAGAIGAARYISIDHPDGLRTTYSLVATVAVARGQVVRAGTVIGTTGARFHFGVRRDGRYIDPAELFGAIVAVGPPALVLRPGRVGPDSEAAPAGRGAVLLLGSGR